MPPGTAATFKRGRAIAALVSASAPPRTFQAECPACDKVSQHEEFFRERRVAQSERAARSGEFSRREEYAFRCTACGARHEKVLDEQGNLHKWHGNRHTMMKIED